MNKTQLRKANRLANNKTIQELVAMRKAIESEPANQMPAGSFWLYTQKAREKTKVINWAIYLKKLEALRASGQLKTSGYSGRQAKK